MAKVTTYKNSKFASFLSVLGYFGIVGGVYFIFNDYPTEGIIIIVIAVVLKLLAGFISSSKAKKAVKKKTIESEK